MSFLRIALFPLICCCLAVSASPQETPPYRNPALPAEQRVADLLSRMTLEEKAAQLTSAMERTVVAALAILPLPGAANPDGFDERKFLGRVLAEALRAKVEAAAAIEQTMLLPPCGPGKIGWLAVCPAIRLTQRIQSG